MSSRPTPESHLDFLSPLSIVPGLGPKRVGALKDSSIHTIGDLLNYLPTRYIDRSHVVRIGDLEQYTETTCTVAGSVERVILERGRKKRLRVIVSDETGQMEAVWFQGVEIYANSIREESRVILTGRVSFYGRHQMIHPMTDQLIEGKKVDFQPFYPVYSIKKTMKEAGVNQKCLHKSVRWILENLQNYPRVLPQAVEKKRGFPPLAQCLKQIHNPQKADELERYMDRLRYEEFYKVALCLRWNRKKYALPGRRMVAGALVEKMRELLPFSLTPGQQKAIDTLHGYAASQHRMHALLQGDVGSGKTLVAFFTCLCALNEGFQVSWMAPTEILARQTFRLINCWLQELGFRGALLCGGIASSEKTAALKGLVSGEIQFAVGTHALFMPSVQYRKLGMVVIDEQQRFGAQQRLALQEKESACDFLLMSATPIPRSLAKTVYGDLDMVTLSGTLPGRKDVATHIVPMHKRDDMERFILREVTLGNRVYYVVPRIEVEQGQGSVSSIDTVHRQLKRGVLRDCGIECIHGRMKSDERELAMEQFRTGESAVLLATSIIEVGIDIAEASVMVIENGEYFGLSQLHQLRGRVGRGSRDAYCFILTGLAKGDTTGYERLRKFCSTGDGFKIAEYDLGFRGPGEPGGYRQSGFHDPVIVEVLKNRALFEEAVKDVHDLFL